MMDDPDVREAVSLYVRGTVSEAEAAEIAGISRAQLRYYARTCGVVAPSGAGNDDPDPPARG
jgi:predicted HTH domain antitoxin